MDITTVLRHTRKGILTHRWALVAACSLATTAGCGLEAGPDDLELDSLDHERIVEIITESTCMPLVAGRNQDVGTVCTTVDDTVDTSAHCGSGATGVMNITYETTGPWQLVNTQLVVGTGLEHIFTNRRGRTAFNLFPHLQGGLQGTTSTTVEVPLCEVGLDGADEICNPVKAHIVARAEVRRQRKNGKWRRKRAWADGESQGCRHRLGNFFTMKLGCSADPEPPPPPVAACETAYAYSPGSTCLLGADFDGDGNDDGNAGWGWSIGPVAPNTTTEWPVYAAVGGCDPNNGTHVGNLSISYDGSTAAVAFERVGSVTLDEEQIYVGSGKLPLDENGELSVDPADAPLVFDLEDATQTSHVVTDLSGEIHVVYHAVACGDGLTPDPDPLSVLTDEFEADDLSAWNVYNPQTADVAVEDGELEVRPNLDAWWYGNDEAVHVNKGVTGDFSVTAKVEVTNLLGQSTVPGAPYRIGGIMLRDPNAAPGQPNTYHMGIGNMATGVATAVSKSTAEGYSDVNVVPASTWPNDPNWSGTQAEMRLCRVGAEVSAYVRLEDQPWTKFDAHVRGDLPTTLAVGPVAYTGFEQEDLRALFDWVEFKTITHPDDCFAD